MADNDPKIYNTPGTTKSKSKSSFVWEHFGFYKINGVLDKTRSICKICTKDYAYSGRELFFFKQVEAQPNEEATGSSSTPLSQSGQNKDDDWLGDVFIVKEEKANPDDKLDSEIETFCNKGGRQSEMVGREGKFISMLELGGKEIFGNSSFKCAL